MVLRDPSPAISVNIRLCGGVPRSELKGAPWPRLAKAGSHDNARNANTMHVSVRSKNDGAPPAIALNKIEDPPIFHQNNHDNNEMGILTQCQPFAPVFEPPSWAVPGVGLTRLEPIGECIGRQTPVDLTAKPAFRVGRSPACDVQLMHSTSSRRHAMIFHHANGSCYVIDCGSAHGTYVNGRRVASCANGGMIVPHKVRRGAIVRFGGAGAPSYVLKSFNFELKSIFQEAKSSDSGELVRRNTRINALGNSSFNRLDQPLILTECKVVLHKRVFGSLASSATLDEDEPPTKRARCSSPPPSPQEPVLRLISPELSVTKTRRVHFNDTPQCFYPAAVTPEELSDNDCC